MSTVEFAIKKETLLNGNNILSPVVRKKVSPSFLNPFGWERIVFIYGKYETIELPEHLIPINLTTKECEKHIEGYKNMLENKNKTQPKIEITNISKFKLQKNDKETINQPGRIIKSQ